MPYRMCSSECSEGERSAVGSRIRCRREVILIDFDQLRVPHEIAPRLDHLHVMTALSERVDDARRESAFEPERA